MLTNGLVSIHTGDIDEEAYFDTLFVNRDLEDESTEAVREIDRCLIAVLETL
jgi:hypothetical protein